MTAEGAETAEALARGTEVLAFASPAGGSGQTSIVANAAWVLAAMGRRVLVLDWGNHAPLVADYLRSFRVDDAAVGEALAAALNVLTRGAPEAARLRLQRFRLPEGGAVHLVAVSSVLSAVPALPDGLGDGAQLRAQLIETGYDYVLLDCPAPVSTAALAQLAQLCEGVAVCFRAHSRVVPAAVTMVRDLANQAQVRLRLVAVPTQLGPDRARAQEQLRRIENQLLRTTGEASSRPQRIEASVIELPSHSYDVFDEVLAVIVDDGAPRASILRITGALTDGAVSTMPPVNPRIRARYERGFGADESAPADVIHLIYDPVDRRWADWITRQLRQVAVEVNTNVDLDSWTDSPDGAELMIIGDRALRSAAVRRLVDRVAGTGDKRLIRVRIDDEVVNPVGAGIRTLDLVHLSEASAKAEVLASLGLVDPVRPAPAQTFVPRFPDTPQRAAVPLVTNAPPRNPMFSGRSAELEVLRDLLLAPGAGITVLVGDAGVGKSELAREYARRFAEDYDLIWWISAQSREAVSAGSRALDPELPSLRRNASGSPYRPANVIDEVPSNLPSALAILADPDFPRPYLLIFDNLDDPSVLELVPRHAPGHVLVTSRRDDLGDIRKSLAVERLEMADSVALLQNYAPELSGEDAEMLAAAVGHLPLTLRMAGAWTRENMDRLMRTAPVSAQAIAATVARLLREQVVQDGEPEPSALRRTWLALDRSLKETPDGRLASRLAELAANLSSDEISLNLLRSAPMLSTLAALTGADGETLLQDPLTFDQVVWTGVRLGVFDISWGPKGVMRIHRALQGAIRESLTADQRDDRLERVQAALADYAPTAAEDDGPEQLARLAELQHHIVACRAVESADRSVRHWIVRQVRYMNAQQLSSVSAAALEIALAALANWPAESDDPLRAALDAEVANILRWQGRYDHAREIDLDVRRRQREVLGPEHLRSHIAGRGIAADRRVEGDYERAKAEDGAAYEGIRNLLGAEHRHTLMAAHNFALSCFLDGDVHTAVVTEREILERRLRLFGPAHPFTWWSAASLGTYQRALGDYRGSDDTLGRARLWISEQRGAEPPDEADVLRVNRSWAATTRRNGKPHVAKDNDTLTLQAYGRLVPSDHPDIWSCRLSLAADHHAMDDSHSAVQLARECLAYYVSELPQGHPFVAVCRHNLSVYLRGVGAKHYEEAQEQAEQARKLLRDALSDSTHPWNLAAELNSVRNLIAVGAVKEAAGAAAAVLDLCRSDLVPRHPYTLAAAHTVDTIDKIMRETQPPVRERHLDIDIDIPQMT